MTDRGLSDGLVLAIDQGTSATKAVVVDRSGTIRSRASVPVTQHHPRPGWAEQDPMEIWQSVQQVVTVATAALPAHAVVAVGLSTQRESVLVWERSTGQPLGPLLGWQDSRGAGLCTTLRERGFAEQIQASTGLPLDAMFSASKAAALLDDVDPDRSRSRRHQLCLGTMDSWLMWQLSGHHHIEVGNASRTQLFNITSRDWDPFLLDLFNIPAEILPAVTTSSGTLSSSCRLHPLPAKVPVTGVLGDSHAALFAHAAWQPGRVKATYGTGSSVMGVAPPSGRVSDMVTRTIAWQLDHPTYALEGNIRSSGATLVWLARLFDTTPDQIAAAAAPVSDGVVLVPAFTGLGAPWWDDQAAALISGLSEGTRREHLARAALESIAYQVEDVVAAIEAETQPITTILADGGPSTNPTLMQLQSDTSNRRVAASRAPELSALGAAHIAGLGAGIWSLTDLESLPRAETTFHPTTEQSCLHNRDRRRAAWHAAIAAARTLHRQEATSAEVR